MANEYTVETPELNYSQLMAEGRQRLDRLQEEARKASAKLAAEDQARRTADAAVQSPFGQYLAGQMAAPVQPTEYKPNFGALAPRVGTDYGTLTQAAPIPGQVQRASQLLQAGPPTSVGQIADNRHAAMASALGMPVGTMMGEPVQAQLPPPVQAPAAQPPAPPLPRNAAEMALLHQLGPYLAQERVAQQQYQTGMGKATLQGEYRNVATSARLAEDMWKESMKYAQALKVAQFRQHTGQPFDWKVAAQGLQAATRAAQAAEMQVQQLQMAGYSNYPPGTPERQMFDEALARLPATVSYQNQWAAVYSGTAQPYLPRVTPAPQGTPTGRAAPVQSSTPPIPGAIPTP